MNCELETNQKKRRFWTMQPCSQERSCEGDCTNYGLKIQSGMLMTSDYIKSLAIMILMTDGEQEPYCNGERGGHWSQSFIGETSYGSNIRFVKPQKTVKETVAAIRAAASSSLGKLISYGVASEVNVDVEYSGKGYYTLAAKIIGPEGLYDFSSSAIVSEKGFYWK